ncbi:uncharacterized protein LOC119670084 [Teleopsis dalmanni]|uniref:uncharacterized protein LOC119670084 n=1 Tax=Teleopsis dalmanni TaxID=139649 RepID=UPI0018CDF475|nr:uncharacterized protein LOC119670084 [Teleopsis dalmanni]
METENWREFLDSIEKNCETAIKENHIKVLDYALTLPKKLRNRVSAIIPYKYKDFDKYAFFIEPIKKQVDSDDEAEEYSSDSDKRQKASFTESECSEVEFLEENHKGFTLVLETPQQVEETQSKQSVNWQTTYLNQQRKDRIKWNTKIYDMEIPLLEKTLDEQAVELMDAAAERFCDWLNSIGTPNLETALTKENLKTLFAIEADKTFLATIQTNPKHIKALPKTVATKLNLPESTLEYKYNKAIKDRLEEIPEKYSAVAFGRTIPVSQRPWLPTTRREPITTTFPEDIASFSKLFKGINHLSTTQKLVDFYKERPHLEKPAYLVKIGEFERQQGVVEREGIPLYTKLKLKY